LRPEELGWSGGVVPGRGAGALGVRWLGTAGFELVCGEHVVLIDPYLTRASLGACVATTLRSDEALLARELPRADAIIAGHTHFDHALDVPSIARRTGARVFGSRSAIALCRGHGVAAEQLACVEPEPGTTTRPREAEIGPFKLRFWTSAHSPLLLGRVPFPGEIADCGDVPMRAQAYRCGAVFGVEIEAAGRRVYHVGSAELVEAGLRVGPVDLALACVAGWTTSERFPERMVAALAPGAVLLHHWDNFFRPYAHAPRALPAMRVERLVDRLGAAAPGLPVGTLPIGGAITL
jgi:L-ascorbate metabolism protein UlaG (beta-lactamase superfamily)